MPLAVRCQCFLSFTPHATHWQRTASGITPWPRLLDACRPITLAFREPIMETMTRVKIGIAVALGLIVIILISQNAQPVKMRLLFIPAEIPLFVLVLIVLALGFGLGWLTAVLLRRKREKI